MNPVVSQEVKKRADFAEHCNNRGLNFAVEVGTECGDFAYQFLSRWKGYRLWCVDPYEPYPSMKYDRTSDLMLATARLAQFVPRVKIIRARSIDAARFINAPAPLGFVYIDAAHDFESVSADIAAWWPRVQSGGILAGHDFDAPHDDVQRAVSRFSEKEGLTIHMTQDDDSPASWYVNKP